jgi:LPS-assembly protein
VDHYETPPSHGRETLYRAIYDLKLDVSTEFFRIFDLKMGGSDRLKHAVTPEIVYEYIPEEDQSDFPSFDELDRIEPKNLITYGFTNIFTARAPKPADDNQTSYTYTPFLRFKLLQSFDVNKEREEDPEPFSAVTAELDLTPGRYVKLDTDTDWSPYDSRLEVFNTALKLWDARGDTLSIDYRYTRETSPTAQDGIETLGVDSELALSDKWRARAGYEYNFFDDKEIETSAGISYQSHCWGVDVDYSVEEDNESYSIMFNLVGLGSIGK